MKYRVKDRVEHDGKTYEPDALIELEDDQAAPLLGVGAVEAVTSAKDKKPKKDEVEGGAASEIAAEGA